MMNVGLHHRRVDPQLSTVLQSELDRCPNHQIVDHSQRLWGQTDEATLKGVMLRHRRAVEVGELTKRQSICDAFTQLAVRGPLTEFKYERGVQPLPKLGDWVEALTEILEKEAKLPKRERRSTQRLFEELRGRGYDGAHDSVH